MVDSSEEEKAESDNENQSERIIHDTNPPTNPSSDGGKLLRWNRMQEEQGKRNTSSIQTRGLQVSRVSLLEDTLSTGKRIRLQPVPKSPRTKTIPR